MIIKVKENEDRTMENKEIIKGYKGFNPDLTCRDFKYEVGKEYDIDKAVSCKTGFHFCENPFDVLNYYAPSSEKGMNRFCEVEGSGEFDKSENDKVACTHIKVNAEIGLQGLITAGIKFILDKVNWKRIQHRLPVSSDQHGLPVSGNQHRRPVSSDQHGLPVSGNQHRRPVSSDQHR